MSRNGFDPASNLGNWVRSVGSDNGFVPQPGIGSLPDPAGWDCPEGSSRYYRGRTPRMSTLPRGNSTPLTDDRGRARSTLVQRPESEDNRADPSSIRDEPGVMAMFRVPIGPRTFRCDGVSRRDFLRVGGLAGVGLPTLLRAEASGASGASPAARSVILLYLGGGLSHHDSFDPKPEAPERGEGASTATTDDEAPRRPVRRTSCPLLAARSDKFAVLRSVYARQRPPRDGHELGPLRQVRVRPSATTPRWARSSPTSWATAARCPRISPCPANPSFTWELGKSAFLGGRYESFKSRRPHRPELQGPGHRPSPAARRRPGSTAARPYAMAVDGLARQADVGRPASARWTSSTRRALDLVLSKEARRRVRHPNREDPRLRDRSTAGRRPASRACWPAAWWKRACGSSPINSGGLGPPRQDLRQRSTAASPSWTAALSALTWTTSTPAAFWIRRSSSRWASSAGRRR